MIATIDPTTGEVLERIPSMDAAQIEAKLEAAARCARTWRSVSFDERADTLRAIARRLRDERDSLAATAVREMGTPI